MKKWLPGILAAIFLAWILSAVRAPKSKDTFDRAEFGRLPVLLGGRIQPFDSVARNALLSMSGKSIVRVKEPQKLSGAKGVFASLTGIYDKAPDDKWWVTTNKLSPTEWLLEAMTRPDDADTRKIFRAQHPDLENLLGAEKGKLEYYSFNDLTNHLEEVEQQARRLAESEKGREDGAKTRTPFQKDLMHLYDSMILYHRIKNSLEPEGSPDFARELGVFQERIAPGLVALQASEAGEKFDETDLQMMASFFKRYQKLASYAYPLAVPPLSGERRDGWKNIGTVLMESMRANEIHPALKSLARVATAYAKNDAAEFNRGVAEYRGWLQSNTLSRELKKARQEFFFNQIEPFYKAMVIYVAALLLGCLYWINLNEWIRRSAFALILVAFSIHTIGLVFRMYLEGRPPVTNLYSSAIFIGWGAVILGMILERIFKGGIGLVAAAFIGFVTQIIAHHLSLSGDTMEMLQAVLDTNIWLATHVVVITTGYASMFIAGLLAIIYILRGFLTRTLSPETAKALTRMVYGIICFATLFSFVGTILGGIWADQSWGRFWGWDPKENGALLIVIWCAITLHARWGGLVKERGLMAMAVVGNVITSFSWFGVNMLGIGLHSYGFMDKAFPWLMAFIASQLILILLAITPARFWASFKNERVSSPLSKTKPLEAGV